MCALQGAQFIKRVRFQVDAPHDIHISLAKSNPPDPLTSFEIVLGAGRASWSTIRDGQVAGGWYRDLTRISHTPSRYNQVGTKYAILV